MEDLRQLFSTLSGPCARFIQGSKMNIQKSPFLVVATEPTPNPAAFKFNLNQQAAASTHAYNNEFEAEGDPFAEKLFSFGVVTAVLIHERFVSVTLESPDEWEFFLDPIIQCIQEDLVYYEAEKTDEDAEENTGSILDKIDLETFDDLPDSTKLQIIDVYMDETVRPALAADGGGVIVTEVADNVVKIRYQGACGSCSKSQSSTLSAMQNILQTNVSPNLRVIVGSTSDQGTNIGGY